VEQAIEMDRGRIYLRLTPEQFAKLRRPWEGTGTLEEQLNSSTRTKASS
jgi:hypothetical protein